MNKKASVFATIILIIIIAIVIYIAYKDTQETNKKAEDFCRDYDMEVISSPPLIPVWYWCTETIEPDTRVMKRLFYDSKDERFYFLEE